METYLKTKGFSEQDAENMVTHKDAVALAEVERCEERRAAGVTWWWVQGCRQCGKPGHKYKTCAKGAAALSD
jgi:hypothetical protein